MSEQTKRHGKKIILLTITNIKKILILIQNSCNKNLQFFNLQKVAMVERVRSINLHREDREPRLRSRHYIYRNIENPNPPPTEIEVLLIDNVDGKDLSL